MVCPGCGRFLKCCTSCGTANRSFACFCRDCRGRLKAWEHGWPSSRGGPRRLGVNAYTPPAVPPEMMLEAVKEIEIPGRCRYLLAEDGFLFAFSMDGCLGVFDIMRPGEPVFRYDFGGKLYAEPVIHGGSLYVGVSDGRQKGTGRVEAFGLGRLGREEPELSRRWDLEAEGIPTQGMMAFGDSLYYKTAFSDGRREVYVLPRVSGSEPGRAVRLYSGDHAGTFAADPGTGRVYFLSVLNSRLMLHTVEHSGDGAVGGVKGDVLPVPVLDGPGDFLEHIPAAVMGTKLFAVFGEEGWLSCLDIRGGRYERRLHKHVKHFACRDLNEYVVVDSSGVFFPLRNSRENFIPGESTLCAPVILGDAAAVVGLRDGRIRFYQLSHPSRQSEFRVFDSSGDEVTALIGFRDYLAVGNQRGVVKLFRIK